MPENPHAMILTITLNDRKVDKYIADIDEFHEIPDIVNGIVPGARPLAWATPDRTEGTIVAMPSAEVIGRWAVDKL